MQPERIVVDGIEYMPVQTLGNVKIVILQRGWVMVGGIYAKSI
mgnify:CR=1 FL=1